MWPIDILTLAYVGAMALLILLFRHNLSDWRWQITFYLCVGAWVILLVSVAGTEPTRKLYFLRTWYPLLLCIFFFENVGNVIHLILPEWQDRIPLAIDLVVLGVHPTLWFQQWVRPWLTEWMQACYTSYFFLCPILAAVLLKRGHLRQAEETLFGTALTYYGCYLFFVFFPIEGPYHALSSSHRVELTGNAVTLLINWIESFARVHGGAFPSAHVAGSTVFLYYAHRYSRCLFWVFLPVVLCLFVATVYGRYHYFADVWTGWAAAALGLVAAARLYPSLNRLLGRNNVYRG